MRENIKLLIARFSRLITDAEDKAKCISGLKDLTSTQISYLETIGELDNPSITELSGALGIQKPSTTVVIERLITKGCVYKVHSDADRRTSHLHLTEIGEQINQRHDFAHGLLADLIEKSLTKEEQAQFNVLLEKVLTAGKTK